MIKVKVCFYTQYPVCRTAQNDKIIYIFKKHITDSSRRTICSLNFREFIGNFYKSWNWLWAAQRMNNLPLNIIINEAMGNEANTQVALLRGKPYKIVYMFPPAVAYVQEKTFLLRSDYRCNLAVPTECSTSPLSCDTDIHIYRNMVLTTEQVTTPISEL